MLRDQDIPRGRVRRRVAAAVLVIDGFTGRIIPGPDVRVVRAETGEGSIRKSDGYHVFTSGESASFGVKVTAPAYQGEEIVVHTALLDPLSPVVKVRLQPNRSYALPAGAIALTGVAEPGAVIRLVCRDDPGALKLLYDYDPGKDGNVIRLFLPTQADIEGREFMIGGKRMSKNLFLRVMHSLGEGAYRLENPLTAGCKKVEDSLLPVYSTRADDKGRYFLPVPAASGHCLIMADGTGHFRQEMELSAGREMRMDLL